MSMPEWLEDQSFIGKPSDLTQKQSDVWDHGFELCFQYMKEHQKPRPIDEHTPKNFSILGLSKDGCAEIYWNGSEFVPERDLADHCFTSTYTHWVELPTLSEGGSE